MPGSIRLYVTSPLAPGGTAEATAGQAHYLAHVMRRSAGDEVLLFNGSDGEFSARIAAIRRERAHFVVERLTREQEAEADIWLVFAPLKRDATDLVVEKATELGVSAIRPVFTEHTQTARLNLERLHAIAVEAAEQSERLSVPAIAAPVRLAELLRDWPRERLLVAAVERRENVTITPAQGPAALLVGPEGGFASGELDALAACPFVVQATLGPRILRAETAAIVGLALLQAGLGA